MNSLIQNNFNKVAGSYDEIAVIMQQIGEQLLQRLQQIDFQPQNIVDIGCGTGWLSNQLAQQYPQAKIIGVDFSHAMLEIAQHNYPSIRFIQADAMATALPAQQFDLIVANNLLHWLPAPEKFFSEVKHLLQAKGVFAFSTVGPDTLKELRQAWAMIDDQPHVNHFTDMHDIGDSLQAAGFVDLVMEMKKVRYEITDVFHLLYTLKALGSSQLNLRRYISRKELQQLAEHYPAEGDNYFVSCEMIYGMARQAEYINIRSANEVSIPLSQLKNRVKQ